MVVGIYAANDIAATWAIGIAPVDEDTPIPQWKVQYQIHKKGYSSELSIECPDDTRLKKVDYSD